MKDVVHCAGYGFHVVDQPCQSWWNVVKQHTHLMVSAIEAMIDLTTDTREQIDVYSEYANPLLSVGWQQQMIPPHRAGEDLAGVDRSGEDGLAKTGLAKTGFTVPCPW